MLTAEQLELRKRLLTATDGPPLCGVSPWRTAYDVYADKRGTGPRFAGNARTRAGQALEPVIIQLATAEHGLALVPNAETLVDTMLPWLGATPDAFEVADTEIRVGVGECKAVGFELAHHWTEDSPPDYVLVQATIQMHVARVDRCRVMALLGTELRLYTIETDRDLDTAILERMDEFKRHHLDTNTPPDPDGSEHAARMLRSLFPRSRKRYVEPTPAIDTLATQVIELRAREAEIERQRKTLEQQIQGMLGDAEGVDGDVYRITWKTRAGYDVKPHTVAPSRPFRCEPKRAKEHAA